MSLDVITPGVFADLMAELPAGVAIITTPTEDGPPMGLAVTSLTAYTAEPASIMTSVAHTSRCHRHLLDTEHFGVHLLHNGQEDIAKVFASKADDKFAELDWEWDDGVPRVHGTLAYMRCAREATFTHLDHTVLIGAIEHVDRADEVDAMLYVRRRFSWRFRRDG
jgi:flavin reductase (DIM6/NTAB) family NADH-FMN oxidoreductase RutF